MLISLFLLTLLAFKIFIINFLWAYYISVFIKSQQKDFDKNRQSTKRLQFTAQKIIVIKIVFCIQ